MKWNELKWKGMQGNKREWKGMNIEMKGNEREWKGMQGNDMFTLKHLEVCLVL